MHSTHWVHDGDLTIVFNPSPTAFRMPPAKCCRIHGRDAPVQITPPPPHLALGARYLSVDPKQCKHDKHECIPPTGCITPECGPQTTTPPHPTPLGWCTPVCLRQLPAHAMHKSTRNLMGRRWEAAEMPKWTWHHQTQKRSSSIEQTRMKPKWLQIPKSTPKVYPLPPNTNNIWVGVGSGRDGGRVGVGSNGVGSDRLWGEGRCWVELGSLRVGRVGGGPLRVGRVGCSCDPIFQQALAQGRFKYMSDHPQTMDT